MEAVTLPRQTTPSMINLHWTVDQSSHTAPPWDYVAEFSGPLANALASPPLDPSATTKFHRYTILPNFWSGFNRDGKDPDLTIGSLSIERERADSQWQYQIEHVNVASGEHLTLDFVCEDKPLRPLRSPWRVHTENDADGSYDGIDWTGTLDDGTIILTTPRGLATPAGSVPDPGKRTSLWTLVDILPSLNGRSVSGFSVLEDLESLSFHGGGRPANGHHSECPRGKPFSGQHPNYLYGRPRRSLRPPSNVLKIRAL